VVAEAQTEHGRGTWYFGSCNNLIRGGADNDKAAEDIPFQHDLLEEQCQSIPFIDLFYYA
jgi:hypothetical protein